MKRIALIISAIVLVIGVLAFFIIRNLMYKPMYEPGMVRTLPHSSLEPLEQSDKDFWLMNDQVKLFRYAKGRGRNVLVIHGGPGYPIIKPFAGLGLLTGSFRFHYYDQRGCGKSSRPIARFTSSNYYENMKLLEQKLGLTAQLSDIERIRRTLGEEKLILIGHSFGAFIASMYAAEFPNRVEAMVLIAPANVLVFPQEERGLFDDIKKLSPPSMIKNYESYLERYFDFGTLFEKNEAELAALNAELIPYYAAALEAKGYELPLEHTSGNGGWMVQAMYFSMGKKHDYRDVLSQVESPVLVVHGKDDLQSVSASRIYADAFPHSRFKIIEKADHFVFNDTTGVFGSTVAEFLQPWIE